MKKTNYLLAMLFLLTACFVSCSSDDEDIFVEEEPKEYKLVSVMWKLDEESGDKVEAITEKLKETIYNYGDVEIWSEFAFLKGVKHSSRFVCEEEDIEFLNKWLEEGELVSIPTEDRDLSSTFKSFISDSKAPLELMKENTMAVTNVSTISGKLPPGTKETYSGTKCFNKITATYRLQFADKNNPYNILNVEGKWYGLIYDKLIDTGAVISYID